MINIHTYNSYAVMLIIRFTAYYDFRKNMFSSGSQNNHNWTKNETQVWFSSLLCFFFLIIIKIV